MRTFVSLNDTQKIPLYYWNKASNFGDQVSKAIVEWMTGKRVAYSRFAGKLIAVGSVLHNACDGDIIWGTGVHPSFHSSSFFPRHLRISAVRGPITRDYLLRHGHWVPEIYGDPAILLPLLFQPGRNQKRVTCGFIPHMYDTTDMRGKYCINVRDCWQKVVREIVMCDRIVSSSLHGIIVAEAYGIPSIWVNTANTEGHLKYIDYYEGTGRKVSPCCTPDEALKETPPVLPPIEELQKALIEAFPSELQRPSL